MGWTWEEGTQEGRGRIPRGPIQPHQGGERVGGELRGEGGIASKNDGCKWCSGAKQECYAFFSAPHLSGSLLSCKLHLLLCYFPPLGFKMWAKQAKAKNEDIWQHEKATQPLKVKSGEQKLSVPLRILILYSLVSVPHQMLPQWQLFDFHDPAINKIHK